MKKITFNVSKQKNYSIATLIKEINKISCRINIDFENEIITVENIDDNAIDSVILLVDKYYSVLSANIDNTLEEDVESQEVSEDTEQYAKSENQETIEESEIKVETETKAADEESATNEQPTVLEPQSPDDLIIKKVAFQNQYIEELLEKYARTIYWGMYKMNISEREIGNYIYTSMREISFRYNYKFRREEKNFSIGDIVECFYGFHLKGEINGDAIPVVVCDIRPTGMAYVVPATRMKQSGRITSKSYIVFDVPEDAVCEERYQEYGTVLLDKGRYVKIERLDKVVGQTTPEFFEKILKRLAGTFDFTKNLENYYHPIGLDDDSEEDSENAEAISMSETETKVQEETIKNIGCTSEKSDTKETEKADAQAEIKKIVGPALEKVNPSIPAEKQVKQFLDEIGMSTSEVITVAFVGSCKLKQLTQTIDYSSVAKWINVKLFANSAVTNKEIKDTMREEWKEWLKKYPELTEKCPKIRFTALLKVFAEKF